MILGSAKAVLQGESSTNNQAMLCQFCATSIGSNSNQQSSTIERGGTHFWVWSSSIVYLYRRDSCTYITFIVFGILCVASFLFAVNGLAGTPTSIVLAVAVGGLGLSLDLLRWYHGHVCQLLDPANAVSAATRRARQTIDRIQQLATKTAKLQHRMLTAEQQTQLSVQDLETTIYPRIPAYPTSVNFWINEIAEIAGKATVRGEKFLANAAINAIGEITKYYLTARKNNLLLMPDPEALFLAVQSDANIVVNTSYEALKR